MKSENQKVSTFSQILLWFGAAVSIAEIMTGALLAPLGLVQGIWAIIIGHVIGGAILFPAGLIGAKTGLSAAESVRISFGKYGSFGFSWINILQLLGWTAIMIINGAKAFDGITNHLWGYQNEKLWCMVIGLLICIWVVISIKNLSKLNTVVMTVLFIFTIILGFTVFKNTSGVIVMEETINFGTAVELNVAMSLSWLPLISDYTRKLEKKITGTLWSVISYFVGSTVMFVIGLGAAIYAGTSDITAILMSAGLGLVALVIVLFSTVTTTFLDVYSAGVSTANLNKKVNEKFAAVIACVVGSLLAMFVPISQYENFLYLIGSVFAPLFAILFVDYFLLHKKDIDPSRSHSIRNIILWVIGFIVYRLLMPYNSIIGITLPVMVAMGVICFIINKRKVGNTNESLN
ncbi:cytosine permease [Tissierella sp. P1]|jgi:putative hydroxymethylpyrimidine transporter CytX|uniref:putative hydroxymethylpyrimidine transporter CytX n=1 Tax=unclassified Tissierella TaxID=2638726 RepID=UPI000BA093FF|nr:putative hydroxymethylpyrimidine transporter CytX [Tissierella sp. P1]MDU5082967.1 putative hydroxymethylpyrimidine transporter CytX [Bacillota bacterium]OZV10999.1 cytosine permease [Tissierella sp. P1]